MPSYGPYSVLFWERLDIVYSILSIDGSSMHEFSASISKLIDFSSISALLPYEFISYD